MSIRDDEMQRKLNAFDEFYAEEERAPETPYVIARLVLLVLSAAVSVSALYWGWRLLHG